MHLELWRKQVSLSQSALGNLLKPAISQGQISQYERGITRVTLDYALQIEQISHGLVTPQDCADMFIQQEKAA